LITGTPLQNSLKELFSLLCPEIFVDYKDLDSFLHKNSTNTENEDERSRKVVEALHKVSFPESYAIVFAQVIMFQTQHLSFKLSDLSHPFLTDQMDVDPNRAFATLATILSYIKRPRKHSKPMLPIPESKRKLLELFNMLATICPRSFEIVAVTARTDVSDIFFT
jgi:hypothetical protein